MATYSEIVTRIRYYTIDNEAPLVATTDPLIDDIIARAESRIHDDLQVEAMVKTASVALVPTAQTLAQPVDFIGSRRIRLIAGDGSVLTLILRDRSWCESLIPVLASAGEPRWYCPYGAGLWRILPAPSVGYTAEIIYDARLTGLSATVTETWLSTNAEELLFKAILAECETFHRNADAKTLYEGEYARELAAHQKRNARQHMDSGL